MYLPTHISVTDSLYKPVLYACRGSWDVGTVWIEQVVFLNRVSNQTEVLRFYKNLKIGKCRFFATLWSIFTYFTKLLHHRKLSFSERKRKLKEIKRERESKNVLVGKLVFSANEYRTTRLRQRKWNGQDE